MRNQTRLIFGGLLLICVFIACAVTNCEDNAVIVQEIFTQARLHTKPELAACKTFECIEGLIYNNTVNSFSA